MKKNLMLTVVSVATFFVACQNNKGKKGDDVGDNPKSPGNNTVANARFASSLLRNHFDSLGMLFDTGVTIKDTAMATAVHGLSPDEQLIAPYRIYPDKLALAMITQLGKPCPTGMNCMPEVSGPDASVRRALSAVFPATDYRIDPVGARHTIESALHYGALHGGASEYNDAANMNTTLYKVTNTTTNKVAYYDITRICPPPKRPGCESRIVIQSDGTSTFQ